MSPLLHTTLLLLHLLGAIVWIGGMFFAHYCLRPAAVETLEPPKRLPLMEATLRRFFRYVAASVLALLGTGFALFLPVSIHRAPIGWHIMFALGIVMALVFMYIWVVLYPRLREHCATTAWPLAGQILNSIRRLVALNLVLGLCTVVAAVSAR
ncbi:MAG: CopD family protein [Gallionellaceae bacterium]|nr:CopD family protein [Gallionellaceae bacterium]